MSGPGDPDKLLSGRHPLSATTVRLLRRLLGMHRPGQPARAEESDLVVGLELGADDYVVKPFSVRELSARIRAITRRRRIEIPLEAGRLHVDRVRRLTLVDGVPKELTAKEFDLLAVLAEEPGRVVPRSELLARVWDPVWHGSGKSLDVHVSVVRRKLGDPALIETVRGVGYRLIETPE